MGTMRALIAQAVGEPADVLRLETKPIPAAGPGQVRLRVQAAPINPNDLHIMRGRYGIAPPMPTPLGQEAVGVVDALGDGVTHLRIGQRVVTVGLLGTWQDYVVHDAAQVLQVPDGLSTSTAAQLVTNPLTATLLVSELDVSQGNGCCRRLPDRLSAGSFCSWPSTRASRPSTWSGASRQSRRSARSAARR